MTTKNLLKQGKPKNIDLPEKAIALPPPEQPPVNNSQAPSPVPLPEQGTQEEQLARNYTISSRTNPDRSEDVTIGGKTEHFTRAEYEAYAGLNMDPKTPITPEQYQKVKNFQAWEEEVATRKAADEELRKAGIKKKLVEQEAVRQGMPPITEEQLNQQLAENKAANPEQQRFGLGDYGGILFAKTPGGTSVGQTFAQASDLVTSNLKFIPGKVTKGLFSSGGGGTGNTAVDKANAEWSKMSDTFNKQIEDVNTADYGSILSSLNRMEAAVVENEGYIHGVGRLDPDYWADDGAAQEEMLINWKEDIKSKKRRLIEAENQNRLNKAALNYGQPVNNEPQ